MDWPEDINDKIVGMLSTDEQRVVRSLNRWTPHRAGAAANPFFHVNEETPVQPFQKTREVARHIPELLVPLYASYGPDTEFSNDNGMVLFSEDGMREVCPGIRDVGFTYMGMGHINVFSYHRGDRRILSHIDGGANGWDRNRNSIARKKALEEYNMGIVQPELTVQGFLAWWEEGYQTPSDQTEE